MTKENKLLGYAGLGKVFVVFGGRLARRRWRFFSAKRQASGEGKEGLGQSDSGSERPCFLTDATNTNYITILDASACFSKDDDTLTKEAPSSTTSQQRERVCNLRIPVR